MVNAELLALTGVKWSHVPGHSQSDVNIMSDGQYLPYVPIPNVIIVYWRCRSDIPFLFTSLVGHAAFSWIVFLEHSELVWHAYPLSHANKFVPDWCFMHFSYQMWEKQVKSFSPPQPESPAPLHPPPAHLSACTFPASIIEINELIPVGLMDFAAKVRRMHFNHGRS